MSDTTVPRSLFFATIAAGIGQCLHDYPLLPERLASHFSASGAANGWMTKSQFLITYAAVIVPALIVEFWVPSKIARTGGDKLRMPNKEYWLAPERRAETFGYFKRFFAWYGCAFLLIEVFAMGLAMRANFQNPPQLPNGPMITAIAAFVVFNIVGVVMMIRRFSM